MKKYDIKQLKIPNVCFSLTNKTDERETEFSEQRKTRGFDESETWSLTDTICKFIIPRLKEFINVNDTYAYPFKNIEEWNEALNKMLIALELIQRDKGCRIYNEEEEEQIEIGLDLFRKHFMGLWW